MIGIEDWTRILWKSLGIWSMKEMDRFNVRLENDSKLVLTFFLYVYFNTIAYLFYLFFFFGFVFVKHFNHFHPGYDWKVEYIVDWFVSWCFIAYQPLWVI